MLDKILDPRRQLVVLSLVGVVIHSIMSGLSTFLLYVSIKVENTDMIINSAAILLINLFIIFIYLQARKGMRRVIKKDG